MPDKESRPIPVVQQLVRLLSALGQMWVIERANGRLLQVSFTMRGNGTFIRVISARDMSAKEKRRYAEES